MTFDKDSLRRALNRRVAVRVYKDQDIPKEDMEFILDSAWQSPSSIGLEPWRFVVLDRPAIAKIADKLKPLAWGAQPQLETASHFVLILAEKKVRYDSASVKESLERRGFDQTASEQRLKGYEDFQKNDLIIADNPRLLFEWAARQTYIALGNLMTTATLIGVDSCPIEGFNYNQVNKLLAQEGLIDPEYEAIACMLSLGYRLRDPKHPHSRKERKRVITWAD